MKRFYLLLPALLVFMSALTFSPMSWAAACGPGVSPLISPTDITNVLFIAPQDLDARKARDLGAQLIKEDIRSAIQKAGIQPEITEKQEDLKPDRFLKVHIYSILLERQVYFCSVAVMQHRPSGDEACKVKEYSNVTSQISNIRSQIQEMVAELLGDIR